MDVNQAVDSPNYFGAQNMLNGEGMVRFWIEIDKNIKSFDKNHNQFKPVHRQQQQFHSSHLRHDKRAFDKPWYFRKGNAWQNNKHNY